MQFASAVTSLLTFLSHFLTHLLFVQCPPCDSSFWTLQSFVIGPITFKPLTFNILKMSLRRCGCLGECSRRSEWVCLAWTSAPSTCYWWTSRAWTTVVTSSTTVAGWSPESRTPRCRNECTFTRTRRLQANTGWTKPSRFTNSN